MPSDRLEWVCRSITPADVTGRHDATWETGGKRPGEPGRRVLARREAGPHSSEAEGRTVKEACGVFGVYAPGRGVAQLTFDGIYALQHRGQESAGMAVSDGETITVVKDMGLVTTVFDERTLSGLPGDLAIGHTRYSTHGSSDWGRPAGLPPGGAGRLRPRPQRQPDQHRRAGRAGRDAAGLGRHRQRPGGRAAGPSPSRRRPHRPTTTATAPTTPCGRPLRTVLPEVEGAFSFVLLDAGHLYGVRDPHGFRPLCLGRLGPADHPEGWVLASETPALDVIGATFVRELEPGELVIIDDDGVHSEQLFAPERVEPHLCIFEFVYFARPDSRLYGREVHGTRRRMGELLAAQAPVEADLVMGVPDSGVPAAEGYARAQRHPLRPGAGQEPLHRPHLHHPGPAGPGGRRAAQAQPAARQHRRQAARRGRRLDRARDHHPGVVAMLREAGATEVHLRISSPPFSWPCFYGIDTPDRDELLAAHLSMPEIEGFLEVDSLAYISLENLMEAIDVPSAGFCDACLTGHYPVPVPVDLTAGQQRHRARLGPGSRDRGGRRPAGRPARGLTAVPAAPGRPVTASRGPATYAGAGVDIAAGDAAVERIRASVASTARPGVLGGIGGFGGLFALDTDRYRAPVLVSSTDGVGTKLLVARATGRYDTVGIDLVAMCVDDLVCAGAEPLFLLDYLAVGKLDPEQIEAVVAGVAEGCRQAGCALLGGETAEHPGAMAPDDLDMAGFAVGVVEATRCLGPDRVGAGDVLVGLPSPGLRSNGYSLARHVLLERAGLALDEPAWAGAPTTRWPTSCCAPR